MSKKNIILNKAFVLLISDREEDIYTIDDIWL